jgi:cytochrome c553
LTEVRHRLTPERIQHIIRDPNRALPHAAMPRVPMTEATMRLITGLLLQTSASITNAGYLSPLDHPPLPEPGFTERDAPIRSARVNYLKYCAACHGETGRGEGFNAAFLPTPPTAHADAAHMSARPDDALFDGIHAGGFILNKSHRMPPWGQTLTAREIRELVGYLRTLCECREPAWAEDDR